MGQYLPKSTMCGMIPYQNGLSMLVARRPRRASNTVSGAAYRSTATDLPRLAKPSSVIELLHGNRRQRADRSILA
jgi:hypothetical protein